MNAGNKSKYDNIKITIKFGVSKSKKYTKAIKLLKQLPNHNLVKDGCQFNECSLSIDDYCRYTNVFSDLILCIYDWKNTSLYIDDVAADFNEFRQIKSNIEYYLYTSKDAKNKFRYDVLQGKILISSLPHPIVYRPESHGTFISFGEDETSLPAMCKCTEDAVENYLKLKENEEYFINGIELDFPKIITKRIKNTNDFKNIIFKEKLCHRCNMPLLPKVGITEFREVYSEYIKMNYFKFGICRIGDEFSFISDICPPDLAKAAELHNKYIMQFNEAYEIEFSKQRTHTFIFTDQLNELTDLHSEQSQYIDTFIENHTRQEFGYRKAEDRWVNETILYQIICSIFEGEKILRHHRSEWLEGLELDIFLPELNIAFEYQGQQHFNPVKAWGGETALKKTQERDKRKLQLCNDIGIKLYTIDYTEPMSKEYIVNKFFLENNIKRW